MNASSNTESQNQTSSSDWSRTLDFLDDEVRREIQHFVILSRFSAKINLLQQSISLEKRYGTDDSLRFCKAAYKADWLAQQHQLYVEGRQPNSSAIFFVRSVLEALMMGSLTEREIRASVMDACKDLGIKCTGRGTIAGLNLDVSTVCGILSGIGYIETDLDAVSNFVVNEPLSSRRKKFLSQEVDLNEGESSSSSGGGSSKKILNGKASATPLTSHDLYHQNGTIDHDASAKAVDSGASLFADEMTLIPPGADSVLYRQLSETWKPRLESYYESSRVLHKLSAIAGAAKAAEAAAAAAAAVAMGALPVDNLGAGGGGGGGDGVTNIGIDHDPTTPSDGLVDDIPQQASSSNNSSGTPQNATHQNGDGYLEQGTASSQSSSSATKDSGPKQVRRASNQRAWKLTRSDNNEMFTDPARMLKAWSDACYREAVALETEEALLRYIAGQCGVTLDTESTRIGTEYLLESCGVNSSSTKLSTAAGGSIAGGMFSETSSSSSSSAGPPTSLLDGAEYTAAMLLEKVKRNRNRVKRRTLSPDGSSFVSSFADDSTTSFKGTKRSFSGGLISPSPLSSSTPSLQQTRRTSAPLHLRNEHAIIDKNPFAKSIFAPIGGSSSSSSSYSAHHHTASLILPDLVIRTAPIPWKQMAAEFQPVDVEDAENPLFALSFTPRESSRGTGGDYGSNKSFKRQFSTSSSMGSLVNMDEYANAYASPHVHHGRNGNSSPHIQTSGRKSAAPFSSAESTDGRRATRSGADGIASASPRDKKAPVVIAPTFREVPNLRIEVSLGSHDQNSSLDNTDDDTSDEAYIVRHEIVLKQMREKWVLRQKLKQEQKELSGSGGGSGGGGGGSSSFANHPGLIIPMEENGDLISTTPMSLSSPRKRVGTPMRSNSSSNSKKRGRPPKFTRNGSIVDDDGVSPRQWGNDSMDMDDGDEYGPGLNASTPSADDRSQQDRGSLAALVETRSFAKKKFSESSRVLSSSSIGSTESLRSSSRPNEFDDEKGWV